MIKRLFASFTFPLLLVSYETATYLSNDMYLPALPQMMSQLHLSAHQAQLTLALWFAGMASTPILFGAISDRFGRRPVLLIGGAVFALASLACALANTLPVLLLLRYIQGAAIPSMMIAGYASIHETYEHSEAIRLIALMSSISVLAPALGPLLGGCLLTLGSWRIIFWLIAILAMATIALLYLRMPESLPVAKQQPIHYKSLLSCYTRLLSNKTYLLHLATLAILFSGFIVWITLSPLLIIQAFHYDTISFGLFQAFIFAFYILGNQAVDPLIKRLGLNTLMQIGMIGLLSGGLLLFLFAYCFPNTLYPYIGAMTLYGLGSSLCFAPLNRLTIEASDEPMGSRVACFTALLMCSLAISCYVAGSLYNGTLLSLANLTSVCALLTYVVYYLNRNTSNLNIQESI